MLITDITIRKEPREVAGQGEQMTLTCAVTTDTGEPFEAHAPWHNAHGLWASDKDGRDPKEIAAWLRNFANAIERMASAKAAA